MPALRYVVADVFTDRPLTGNQLAVFTDGRDVDDETMQALAREMNFAETVFVLPPSEGGHARLRIFTPVTELPFAGHPVLGSAFVLAAPMQLGEIRLETGSGVVPILLDREGARITFGWMSQPVPAWEPFAQAGKVQELLGIESRLPVELYRLGPGHAYFALESEAEVAALQPAFGALARVAHAGINCFARSGDGWKTRMFAPADGVPEDAATGSAAGPLAVHLARHGWIEFGDEIEISQGVELGRPSTLYARAFGEGDHIDRVEVGGSAVIVARGERSTTATIVAPAAAVATTSGSDTSICAGGGSSTSAASNSSVSRSTNHVPSTVRTSAFIGLFHEAMRRRVPWRVARRQVERVRTPGSRDRPPHMRRRTPSDRCRRSAHEFPSRSDNIQKLELSLSSATTLLKISNFFLFVS